MDIYNLVLLCSYKFNLSTLTYKNYLNTKKKNIYTTKLRIKIHNKNINN